MRRRFSKPWNAADKNCADDQKQDALIRPLEIMGEAVSRVSTAFRTANPDLMPWSTVKAMRNLLIHGYDTVDLDEVWTMVTHDVPCYVINCGHGWRRKSTGRTSQIP